MQPGVPPDWSREGIMAHYGGLSGFELAELRATDAGRLAVDRPRVRGDGQARRYFAIGTPEEIADRIERWVR